MYYNPVLNTYSTANVEMLERMRNLEKGYSALKSITAEQRTFLAFLQSTQPPNQNRIMLSNDIAKLLDASDLLTQQLFDTLETTKALLSQPQLAQENSELLELNLVTAAAVRSEAEIILGNSGNMLRTLSKV